MTEEVATDRLWFLARELKQLWWAWWATTPTLKIRSFDLSDTGAIADILKKKNFAFVTTPKFADGIYGVSQINPPDFSKVESQYFPIILLMDYLRVCVIFLWLMIYIFLKLQKWSFLKCRSSKKYMCTPCSSISHTEYVYINQTLWQIMVNTNYWMVKFKKPVFESIPTWWLVALSLKKVIRMMMGIVSPQASQYTLRSLLSKWSNNMWFEAGFRIRCFCLDPNQVFKFLLIRIQFFKICLDPDPDLRKKRVQKVNN